jgi:hypothetical protein
LILEAFEEPGDGIFLGDRGFGGGRHVERGELDRGLGSGSVSDGGRGCEPLTDFLAQAVEVGAELLVGAGLR